MGNAMTICQNCSKESPPPDDDENTISLTNIHAPTVQCPVDPFVIGTTLYATHDYKVQSTHELPLMTGDEVKVTQEGNDEWIYCLHQTTKMEGYCPKNYLKFDTSGLMKEDWYLDVPRFESQNYLMTPNNQVGTFLVRSSESTAGEFAISVKVKSEDSGKKVGVKHFKIRFVNEQYYIIKSEMFNTVPELIYHYRTNSFSYPLLYPYGKKKPVQFDLSREARDEFEIDRSSVRGISKLGEGNFGTVWHGLHNNTKEIAIKTLKEGKMSKEAFLAEAKIMKELKHPNILVLYAVCTTREPLLIITEYMNKGSLLSVLREDDDIEFPNLIYIAFQVAAGMAYLESKKLVHRDLAARNVLVDDAFVCKIADFGLARVIEDSEYNPTGDTKFPVKWSAPECISHQKFTIKSDVWSYGILLYEIFTRGSTPYPGMSNKEVLECLRNGYRMPCPRECPEKIYDLMRYCWYEKPEKRYTFSSLEESFKTFYSDDTQYA